jgi:hypothetical protein
MDTGLHFIRSEHFFRNHEFTSGRRAPRNRRRREQAMDESTQRELSELRALLAKHGPASVLSTVGALCADEAKNRSAAEDVELWEVAATAATDAATSLAESEEGDEDSEDDHEDEEAEEDDEGDDEEHAPDEAQVDTDGEEVATKTKPQATERRTTTMPSKDQRLGPRPADATHWGCFRVDAGGEWTKLDMDERGDGICVSEWPLKTCTADAIAERWGDGEFIVQYYAYDEQGKRRAVGRSRKIPVRGRQTAAEPAAGATMPAAAPPAPAPAPMPVAAPQTPLGAPMDPWAVITYMRDAEARAHAEARALAHQELQRISSETKEREARYRAEMDLQMERERLASKERIVQMELQAKSAGRSRGMDPDLAAQLGQVLEKFSKMEERVEELEAFEEEDEEYVAVPANAASAPAASPVTVAAPPAPPDPMQELFMQLVPHLGPMAHTLLAKFMEGRPPLSIPDGVSFPGPKDPSKKPN